MKNKMQLISILFLVLLFLAFIIRRWNEPVKKEVFDRYPASLTYSKHARCRMQCRQIDEDEVQEIMHRGIINFNKSNRRDRPCPTFALQGQTSSGEKLRVIFAQCPSETTVVTCYNLEEEFECECPGDEKKNKN